MTYNLVIIINFVSVPINTNIKSYKKEIRYIYWDLAIIFFIK